MLVDNVGDDVVSYDGDDGDDDDGDDDDDDDIIGIDDRARSNNGYVVVFVLS